MDLFSEKNFKTQQGMEFSNPRTSKHQWYTLEHENQVCKVFEYTDREGQTQKIGMSKSKFKAIEELMDEKKVEDNIESKVKELLADPNFRKFFQTK